MINVAAITSGKYSPSARFRIRQHIDKLREFNISVKEYYPIIPKHKPLPLLSGKVNYKAILPLYILWYGLKLLSRIPNIAGSWRHDITWLERGLLSRIYSLERLLKHPVVLDVDDAIFSISIRDSAANIAKISDVIIVGNSFLANWYEKFNKKIYIIPTAIDTHIYKPSNNRSTNSDFIIGWIGTRGNYVYFSEVFDTIKRFLDNHKAKFYIMSDKHPDFYHEKLRYFKWSPKEELEFIDKIDVGIMPLKDDTWSRGKCAFKMLQYMAYEKPVVVSPIGMNKTILEQEEVGLAATNNSDWYDALEFLYKNRELGVIFGKKGRRLVENYYSVDVISPKIAQIFNSLV